MTRFDANSIPGDDIRGTHVTKAFPEEHQSAIRRLDSAIRIARRMGQHNKADVIHKRLQGVYDRQHQQANQRCNHVFD